MAGAGNRLVWSGVLALAAFGCGTAHERDRRELGDRDAGELPDASPPPPRCGIDTRVWALENEPLVVSLECETGESFPRERVRFENLPFGVEFDRDSAELRWTPALDQAGDHVIVVLLPGGERGQIQVGVADRFEHPDNVPIENPLRYAYEFGLPVFHLGVGADLNGDTHTPATIVYAGRELHGASAKYRGSTSANYPKRSFTLKFDKDDPFIDTARGFLGARRIVLTTNFDDNSNLRQRLAFELWNKLDATHLPVQGFNAVVYLDRQYLGLYAVADHVDDDYARAVGIARGANIYKGRQHSANFRLTDENGKAKKTLHAGYSKDEGSPEEGEDGAFDDLDALVDWIANTSDDDFYASWESRLARRDFEDWLVFTHWIAAGDSTNKNCYLIHDPSATAPDPRWRFVPWDFNTSFGQGYLTQRLLAETQDLDKYKNKNALFERMLRDPRLRGPMIERYRTVLDGPWSLEEIEATIDAWSAEIARAAERDDVKWGETFRAYWTGNKRREFTNSAQEAAYIREWVALRWRWMRDTLPSGL